MINYGALYRGDCLDVMRGMDAGSVDLIYLDPPYCTQKNWGEFDDRWESFDVYLVFMEERLRECHRVLAETGSLYLHVDPNTSHYLKVMLDGIFGRKNFRNEIVWSYRHFSREGRDFQKTHDVLFRYVAGKVFSWNQQYEQKSEGSLKRWGTKSVVHEPHPKTGKKRVVASDQESKGVCMRDVWEISGFTGPSHEYCGYPTQKPIALLDRIIQASSNAGDLVLDPFCGSGTTLAAARQLGRRYIGIDQNPNAIELCTDRLAKTQPALIAA